MEKQELIDRLHVTRAALDAAVAGIDPDGEIYAGWTIKHLLAHIAGWDDAVIAALRAHMGGEEPGTPATEGIDAYNDLSVATRESLSLGQVRSECDLSRRELLGLLATIPDETYRAPLLFPWGARGSVEELASIFSHHEQVHAAEVQSLVSEGKIIKGVS
ncbi:MAG TPA: DinB family protein [Anaerolineae bacterium]|nr:DinB family protein [Anaerolineae bacterium]